MNVQDLGFIHRYEPGEEHDATLLLLHGTGGTELDLLEPGRFLLPGANRLSPRGPVTENGMARFFRRISEGVFDLEDLRLRTADLAAFVARSAGIYGFDPGKVVALGYSNGANIAASLLLSGTGTLAGAVLLRPMVPFEPDSPPELSGVPVFISSGRRDPLIRPESAERLAELLTAGGAVVDIRWQDGGHGLVPGEIEAVREWIRTGGQPWN